jgi:hypothetical protein
MRNATEVFAARREDVDHHRTFRACGRRVRRVRRDAPGPAGSELAVFVADSEINPSLEDDPELLVLVAVLGDDGAGIELDHAHRDPRTVNGARRDALPDLLRSDRAEIGKSGQRLLPRRKM